jgi:spore coat polysaccharide biosynthesis protein SpsF (cytidylyltransferase family)
MEGLERAWREAIAAEDREHVTPYIRRSPGFRLAALAARARLLGGALDDR